MMRLTATCLAIVASNSEDPPEPNLKEWKEGQDEQKQNAAAAAADESKMAAVNKVVTMLEDLRTQVLGEGEKEAAAYNKFACFCKDTSAEKSASIKTGTDDEASIQSAISTLATKRDDLDKKIAETEGLIEKAHEEIKSATDERKEINMEYVKNEADLAGAIEALEGAMSVLKSSKPSLSQLNSVQKTVRSAALLADALGVGGSATQRTVALFMQQDPAVPMEDYKFHSASVIEILEKLHADFRSEKHEIDAAEVKSVAEYDAFMQEKNDHVRVKTQELEDTKKDKSITIEEIAMNSEELTTVAAQLLDDKQYASELAEMCTATQKTWDQRSKVRADEITALTAATAIVKSSVSEKTSSATLRLAQDGVSVQMAHQVAHSEQAMEALEVAAEAADSSPTFLQRRSISQHTPSIEVAAREAVVAILKKSGAQYKSALLTSLASQLSGSADPFAKIKKLIQELIQRLLHEAASESNQKGWCDKATSDAKQKRTYAADEIANLNGEMAELEAVRNKLLAELGTLVDEIAQLEQNKDDTTKMRNEESAENEATITEAKAGLEAVEEAIDILDKFYKTAAKESVDLGLLQGPADDAPKTGFGIGEAYTGASAESGGILGMLDVIKSDFVRTISETEQAEVSAQDEYRNFMTETGKSLAEKKMANEQKLKQKDDAIQKLEQAGEDLDAQVKILQLAVQELIELKKVCIDTGMSYEERVSRREDEIEALKKALCVLTAYQDYGPEAAGSQC